MQSTLGLGQRAEGRERTPMHAFGEVRIADDPDHIGRRTRRRVGFGVHVHLRARDPRSQHRFGLQIPPRHRKRLEQGTDLIHIGTSIDEGAQGHVAGDSREAVEPRHGGSRRRECGGKIGEPHDITLRMSVIMPVVVSVIVRVLLRVIMVVIRHRIAPHCGC